MKKFRKGTFNVLKVKGLRDALGDGLIKIADKHHVALEVFDDAEKDDALIVDYYITGNTTKLCGAILDELKAEARKQGKVELVIDAKGEEVWG